MTNKDQLIVFGFCVHAVEGLNAVWFEDRFLGVIKVLLAKDLHINYYFYQVIREFYRVDGDTTAHIFRKDENWYKLRKGIHGPLQAAIFQYIPKRPQTFINGNNPNNKFGKVRSASQCDVLHWIEYISFNNGYSLFSPCFDLYLPKYNCLLKYCWAIRSCMLIIASCKLWEYTWLL